MRWRAPDCLLCRSRARDTRYRARLGDDAEVHRDRAALDAILDDRFVLTFGGEPPMDKATVMKSILASDSPSPSTTSEERIIVDGDVGRFVGRWHLRAGRGRQACEEGQSRYDDVRSPRWAVARAGGAHGPLTLASGQSCGRVALHRSAAGDVTQLRRTLDRQANVQRRGSPPKAVEPLTRSHSPRARLSCP